MTRASSWYLYLVDLARENGEILFSIDIITNTLKIKLANGKDESLKKSIAFRLNTLDCPYKIEFVNSLDH